jgi:DNA-binding SARP family transcriptional activator
MGSSIILKYGAGCFWEDLTPQKHPAPYFCDDAQNSHFSLLPYCWGYCIIILSQGRKAKYFINFFYNLLISEPAMLKPVHLRLLGGFDLFYCNEPVDTINSARLQNLIAYLGLHRSAPQLRSQVAFVLWPDSSESQARANLRKLIHQLRAAFPPLTEYISFASQTLQWQAAAPFTSDVDQFMRAAAEGRYVEAVELYSGDLLPAFFDDWILSERERLQQTYAQCLDALIQRSENDRNYVLAIRTTQTLLRLDPLREETHRRLIRLHALNGDRVAALQAYHHCVTVLQRELAVEPDTATRSLYDQLISTQQPADQAASLLSIPPLIGRSEEWSLLLAAWRESNAGHPQLVLITGEAGIGKTRLAEELHTWADRLGVATAVTHCYAAEGAPAYSPIINWLRSRPLSVMEPVWLSEVVRLLPELIVRDPSLPLPGPLTESWQRQRLHEAMARGLLGRIEKTTTPLLLFIEDLQWCDRDSLEWLRYLIRYNPHARLLIVGTIRIEEISNNPAINELIEALRSNRQICEISLGPLDQAETARLAEYMSEHKYSLVALARLYRETEGNPLFVVEMVRVTEAHHLDLRPAQSGAQWLPTSIQAVIHARLAQLSPNAHEIANAAAVIGQKVTFEILKKSCELDEEPFVQGLDELWQRRILREEGQDAYDFTHNKIQEQAYTNLSGARRRMYHHRVADALIGSYAQQLDSASAQIASHFEKARMPDQAIEFYIRAADLAQRVFAIRDGITYCRRALSVIESLDHGSPHTAACFLLTEKLGDILVLAGEKDEALRAFQRAQTLIEENNLLASCRIYRKIGNLNASIWQHQAAWDAFEKAEEALNLGDPTEMTRLRHADTLPLLREWVQVQIDRHWIYYKLASYQEMEDNVARVRPIVLKVGTSLQKAQYNHCLIGTNNRRDRYTVSDQTLAYCQSRLAATQELNDANEIAHARFTLGFCLLWYGNLNLAKENLHAALDWAQHSSNVDLTTLSLTYLTILYRKLGSYEEVKAYASRALVAASQSQTEIYAAVARANLAWLAWRQADFSNAYDLAMAAFRVLQEAKSYPFHWLALWPLIGMAIRKADISTALDYARDLIEPNQQLLPPAINSLLVSAVHDWDAQQSAQALKSLLKAADLAQEESGYL